MNSFYDDKKGGIAIDYNGMGFSYFDKSLDSFTNYRPGNPDENNIGNHDIQCFFSQTDGPLWIGTNNGLYAYQHSDRHIRHFDFPYKMSIISLRVDNVGNLWIGTDSSGGDAETSLFLYEISSDRL